MKTIVSPKTGLSWAVVEQPLAAQMLLEPDSAKYFKPFLAGAKTAGEAAKVLGVRVDTMMYRIERMVELGLLERTCTPTRTRKRYRATFERCVVPFDASHFETLVDLMTLHFGAASQAFVRGLVQAVAGRQGGWMVRIAPNPSELGRVVMDAAPCEELDWDMGELLHPEAPATWYTWQRLRLRPEQAKALQHELSSLFARYDAQCSVTDFHPATTPHVLHLALAPSPDAPLTK